jgi:predicted O-methyltransferase YrrM
MKYYIRYLTPVYMYLLQNIEYFIYNHTKVNIISKFLGINERIIKDYYKEISHIKVNVPGMAAALDSIYVIIRVLKPNIIVETGVANGASSFYILLALKRNKKGHLFSIDFPNLDPTAIIPQNKEVGWLVPQVLRDRWTLIFGKIEEKLPKLLEELGSIDIFYHDSLHTYEHMMFEYKLAWGKLNKGGLLISDNIDLNNAFKDFCKEVKASWIDLANVGLNVGFALKK